MLRTYGWVPRWRIVFSTFPRCMSFYTAWVIRRHGGAFGPRLLYPSKRTNPDAVGQTAAVFAALAAATEPMAAAEIAAAFRKTKNMDKTIAGVLASLARLGHVTTRDGKTFRFGGRPRCDSIAPTNFPRIEARPSIVLTLFLTTVFLYASRSSRASSIAMLDDGARCGVPHIGRRDGAPGGAGPLARARAPRDPHPLKVDLGSRKLGAQTGPRKSGREPRKLPGASRRSIPSFGETEKGKRRAPGVSKQPACGALAV